MSEQAEPAAPESTNFGPATPEFRRLRVFAFDPSLDVSVDTLGVNQVVIRLPWEDLQPGPVGRAVEVMDIDPASGVSYPPVDLNAPRMLAEDGFEPSTGNPQFHQQMVYAVVMNTITHFERALGRVALWPERPLPRGAGEARRYARVEKLRVYPHALREANAYYDPDKVALLFGYFRAAPNRKGAVLPGGTVFTCLSQDIIVHETTHALLDGLHPRFAEPTNPDVLAFHEAFADLVALFQHFTYPEVLRHQIARTRGDLASETLLAQLAREFGQGQGHYGALRDALGEDVDGTWRPADPYGVEYSQLHEPHRRGAVLVGAVFDAFVLMYKARTADLMRLASGGSGVLGSGAIHPDLVGRLAAEAARVAAHILEMGIRALDYCPPVDITFGEYLRALITADYEVSRADERGYRAAFIDAFRRRAIYPADVRSLSETSLRWQPPEARVERALAGVLVNPRLTGTLLRVADWNLRSGREGAARHSALAAKAFQGHLTRALRANPSLMADLGLDLQPAGAATPKTKRGQRREVETFQVHSVRPARRLSPAGDLEMDLVIELIQTRDETRQMYAQRQQAEDGGLFLFRGGCTLIVDLLALTRASRGEAEDRLVRYVIYKRMASQNRRERQWVYQHGRPRPELYFASPPGRDAGMSPFALLHRHLGGTDDTY